MAKDQALVVLVRQRREAHGWSQTELATRSGLSRTGISAIETGRSAPSTAAALALAEALGGRVEDLFALAGSSDRETAWAWDPPQADARFWQARCAGRVLRYPVEPPAAGTLPHDGRHRHGSTASAGDPEKTLIVAGCDPAVGLLCAEAARQEGLRLIALTRSSATGLELLDRGLVHLAGLHLGAGSDRSANAAAVRARAGAGYRLLRITEWEEGLATRAERSPASLAAALRARLRWVGREAGSGARQCLDEILEGRRKPRHLARNHRGVSEAIRSGYADAGVCLRLVTEEAGLSFLPIRSEPYELCFSEELLDDWRLQALVRVVRSRSYRRLLRDLPGYDSRTAGRLTKIA